MTEPTDAPLKTVPDHTITVTPLPPPTPPTTVPTATGVLAPEHVALFNGPGGERTNVPDPGFKPFPVDPTIARAIAMGIDLNNEDFPEVGSVGTGVDVPPVPKFAAGQLVYHRATGERVYVVGAVQQCAVPDHAAAHAEGAKFGSLPDCAYGWTGDYVVSPRAGLHVMATEGELVETAGGGT